MTAFESGIEQFFAAIQQASKLTFTSSQIWALDAKGFHSVYSNQVADDKYRELARYACLYNQPTAGQDCCAYPFKLSEKQSGALVFGFDGQITPQQSRTIENQIEQTNEQLNELMAIELFSSLSGSALRADWLGKAISLAYEVEYAEQPKRIYAQIHHALKQLMYAENFFVVKLDPSSKFVSFAYLADQYDFKAEDISITQGVLQGSFSAYVVKTGRLMRGSSSELTKQIGLESISDYGKEAYDWLGVPLVIGEEVFGAMVVQIYEPGIRFNDRDPNLLSLIADALATSFQRRKITKQLECQVASRTAELNLSLSQLEASMTELKNVQKLLVETEKQAALGRLVSGIAHELNTPLGVCTTANSLIGECSKKLNQKFQTNTLTKLDLAQFIEKLQSSGDLLSSNLDKASQLIERFKQVSAQQQGEQPRWFNLNTHLAWMEDSFSGKQNDFHYQLKTHCGGDIQVYSYPHALAQVIEQLIENSLTHGFNNQSDGLVEIDIEQREQQVVITYEDNGVGIDDTIAAKAFDPFVTTTRSNGSVGIGLHIIANTVTQTLKGDIGFCDKTDAGVKLQIRFPVS